VVTFGGLDNQKKLVSSPPGTVREMVEELGDEC
jgi:hypothetical protein